MFSEMKPRADLNPRPPPYQAPSPIDWEKFAKWLFLEYRPKTAKNRLNYANKFSHCLLKGNPTDLRLMSDDKQLHAMKSLSSLAKFLGIYEAWRRMVKNYGLKWNGKSSDDISIERLRKTANPNEIFEWIKTVKETCVELSDFLDSMAITGLRFIESIESYNLIIKLSKHEKLSEYYDVEREILQHFRFKDTFLRKTKKAFISFAPSGIVGKVSEKMPLTEDIIHGRLKRRHIPLRFSDIRELHGTLLAKHLRQPEIDFLHRRVSTTVFMRNYFNPTWITDQKARTFRAIREIEKATRNS